MDVETGWNAQASGTLQDVPGHPGLRIADCGGEGNCGWNCIAVGMTLAKGTLSPAEAIRDA
eukprot:2299282-Alexandrium_andersonii.AAC.1